MVAGPKATLTFEIYKAGTLLRTETLTQSVIKIGKLGSSHLRIEDESVARMHAVIEVSDAGEVSIIDLGSTRGTVVNGQKVSKTRLQSDDQVEIGDIRLVVKIAEAQVSTPAPVASVAATETQPMGVMTLKNPVPSHSSGEQSSASGGTAPGVVDAPRPAAPGLPPPPVSSAPVRPSVPVPPIPAPPMAMHAAQSVPAPGSSFGGGHHGAAHGAPVAMAPLASISSPDVEEQGVRAIEVTAMLGPRVIDVRYFTDPKVGGVSKQTRMLFGVGFATTIIALGIFFAVLARESSSRAAKEEWIAKGQEAAKFVESSPSPMLDWLAIGSLVVAFVALGKALRKRSEEKHAVEYVIGSDEDATYKVGASELPTGQLPIVRSTGEDYEAVWMPNMSGQAQMDGRSYNLSEVPGARSSSEVPGAMAWSLPIGSRLILDVGKNRFVMAGTAQPKNHPVPFMTNFRASEQAYTVASALAHAAFLILIFSIPPDPKSLSFDAFGMENRFVQFQVKPPEEKEEKIPDNLVKKGPDDAGGKGKRHKGEEGQMGDPKQPKDKKGLYGLKGPKDNPDPHMARTLAENAATSAGILGVIKKSEGSHIASIFGRDSALGNDPENVLGGLIGNRIGEAYGVGGLGAKGTGRGGGGTGEGTIGLGNIGTIGKGGGGGSGSGYGRGAGGLARHSAGTPDVIPGQAQVRGSLDKEIIRRVIRKHINEVKFCYEQELLKSPGLDGRVLVQFTIDPSGRVVQSNAVQSSTRNQTLDSCVATAVRRWEFPKPQGGGIVVVSYPFVFSPQGT